MAEGINVRFAGPLQRFIQTRTGPGGFYQSASEYIRDLVRHDFDKEQEKQREGLYQELQAGAEAATSEFVPLDIEATIKAAKQRHSENSR
jgi:antitoxin ParD1/3/4